MDHTLSSKALSGSVPPWSHPQAPRWTWICTRRKVGSQHPEKAVPWPHLHELCAGAHVLPEAQKEVLFCRQDLCQLGDTERDTTFRRDIRGQSGLSHRKEERASGEAAWKSHYAIFLENRDWWLFNVEKKPFREVLPGYTSPYGKGSWTHRKQCTFKMQAPRFQRSLSR